MSDPQEPYRRRVTAIYQQYAPEKISAVNSSLAKYRGQEEALIEALVTKYGPEPGDNGAMGLPPPSPSTPRQQQLSMPGSTPPASLQRQNTMSDPAFGSFFGSPQASMVFSNDASPGGAMPPDVNLDDDFASVRRIVKESQFQNAEHERMWEEAWLGKIPLSTISKYAGGDQTPLLDGFGFKLASRPKAFTRKYQKRFFLLLPYFLYYFDSDELTSECRGALYMDGASVAEVEHEGKTLIEIQSRVQHKPAQLDPDGNYSAFKIYFESTRVQAKWFQVLSEMTKVKVRAKSMGPQQMALERARSQHQMQSQYSMNQGYQSSNNSRTPTPTGQQQQQQQQQSQNQQQLPSAQQLAGSPSASGLGGMALASPGTQAPTGTILVSEDNVKNRIRRLAKQDGRDPTIVIEKLTEFICKVPCGGQDLWDLMEELEGVEKKEGSKQETGAGKIADGPNAELIELKANQSALEKKLEEQSALI